MRSERNIVQKFRGQLTNLQCDARKLRNGRACVPLRGDLSKPSKQRFQKLARAVPTCGTTLVN